MFGVLGDEGVQIVFVCRILVWVVDGVDCVPRV